MLRSVLAATTLVAFAGLSFAAGAHDGAHAEVLMRPGRLPDVELPPQAQAGTGINGDFNPHALAAHWLKFQLADGRVLHAMRKRLISDPRRGESWVGEFENAPGSLMVLTRYRGVTTGFFHYGPDVYEITPGRGGQHMVYRVDDSKIPRHAPPLKAPAGEGTTDGGTSGGTVSTAASGVVQDLLVLYTGASRVRYGEAGVQSMILSAISAANQAYANSGIAFTLNLVHMAETQYVETGDMGVALDKLRAQGDSVMEDAHTLRDLHGADLVALVDEDTNYCGIAYVMSAISSGFAPYAFSVTASNCLSGQTLAHEIGHNQGNMHDRANSSSAGAYPYSYGFQRCMTDGTGFRTIMAYSCSGGTRVNHFANPAVTYNGYATGVSYELDPANSADTARSMSNTATTLAAFRAGAVTEVPAAPSSLVATAASTSRVDLRWTDSSTNESGFVVDRSDDNGVNYAVVGELGSNAVSYADNSVAALRTYWYRVRAYNAVGGSGNSNAVSVTTPDLPPATPTGVSAAVSGSLVTVSWGDASSNETRFEIARETYNARNKRWGSITVVGEVATGAVTFVHSSGSGTFRYRVRSVNGGGASSWAGPSAQITVAGSTGGGGKGGKGG